MDLFICAQDIQFITFGLLRDQTLIFEKTFEVPPEQYLFSLDAFLVEQQLSPKDVSRLLVVNGPGSFTASRVSVTMANTLAFVHQIPVLALENPDRLALKDWISRIGTMQEHVFVVPAYDRPPNIT